MIGVYRENMRYFTATTGNRTEYWYVGGPLLAVSSRYIHLILVRLNIRYRDKRTFRSGRGRFDGFWLFQTDSCAVCRDRANLSPSTKMKRVGLRRGSAFLLLEPERPVDMHVALRKRNDDIVFLEYPVHFESNRAANAAKCSIFR